MSNLIPKAEAAAEDRTDQLRLVRHALTRIAQDGAAEKGRKSSSRNSPSSLSGRNVSGFSHEVTLEEEFHRGFEEGRVNAKTELEQTTQEKLQSDRHQIEKLCQSMLDQLSVLQERTERFIVRFALAVAEIIVKREIELDPELLLRQVREALRRVVGVEQIKLRVNPQDELILREHRNTLLSTADSIREVVIEADEKIERGGCMLESDSGNVDARLATQLKQIEAALFERGPE